MRSGGGNREGVIDFFNGKENKVQVKNQRKINSQQSKDCQTFPTQRIISNWVSLIKTYNQ